MYFNRLNCQTQNWKVLGSNPTMCLNGRGIILNSGPKLFVLVVD